MKVITFGIVFGVLAALFLGNVKEPTSTVRIVYVTVDQ